MSQKELSKKTGLSQSYLSELENNVAKNPSITVIKLIAKKLGVKIDDLVD